MAATTSSVAPPLRVTELERFSSAALCAAVFFLVDEDFFVPVDRLFEEELLLEELPEDLLLDVADERELPEVLFPEELLPEVLLPTPLFFFPVFDAIRSSCNHKTINGYAAATVCRSGVKNRQMERPFCSLAAVRVLRMSMAMVMGPTPPGTGVMAEQRGATAS